MSSSCDVRRQYWILSRCAHSTQAKQNKHFLAIVNADEMQLMFRKTNEVFVFFLQRKKNKNRMIRNNNNNSDRRPAQKWRFRINIITLCLWHSMELNDGIEGGPF